MNAGDLKLLSLKLLETGIAPAGLFLVPNKKYQERTRTLPGELRAGVNGLIEDLAEIIPDDFRFWVAFGSEGVVLRLTFEDGNVESGAGTELFTSRQAMLGEVRAIDWDKRRAELIKEGGVFERLASEAADRPVNIPSSQKAAAEWVPQLEEIAQRLQTARKTVPYALAFARNDFGVYVQDHPCRAAVVHQMADVMTTGCDILAVYEGRTPWTFDVIEAAKLEAVEQLGPISRAKAERRLVL